MFLTYWIINKLCRKARRLEWLEANEQSQPPGFPASRLQVFSTGYFFFLIFFYFLNQHGHKFPAVVYDTVIHLLKYR